LDEFMEHNARLLKSLRDTAKILRQDAIEMIYHARSGHPGGSLSAADLITVLFFQHLRIDPLRPDWPERDRFILSKGHAAPILYAALARRGFFPVEELSTLRSLDSRLQGHPDRLKTPGVEMTTGALGHGISIGVGLAYALTLDGINSKVIVLTGDGECQAGVIWEGVMAAAKYKLSNLTVIIDYNDVQLDGPIEEIMPLEPLAQKWTAFNWNVLEIDGHEIIQILAALNQDREDLEKPTVIIAHTVKGKGVSFMENQATWHGRAPTDVEYALAMSELSSEMTIHE